MQKRLSFICLAVLATTIFHTHASAKDMFGFFLKKQRQALPAIVVECLFECNDAACSTAMRDLVQAEMGLVSYGKNYLDEDLYSRLSSELGENQHREFAWLVLKTRLKMSNCEIEASDSVFP